MRMWLGTRAGGAMVGAADARVSVLDHGFTVADAYLVTTLNWAAPGGIDLSAWPVLVAYRDRLMQRPSVARAVAEEAALRG